MHHVSSSLSEIPYGGFSPVRLQTGRQRQPSPLRAYMPPKLLQFPLTVAQSGNRRTGAALRPEPSKHTGPEALGSASGYAVPSRHRLLWPHPSFWPAPAGLCFRRLVFALRPPARRSLLSSANPSRRAASRTPADRMAWDDSTSIRNSLRPNARGSASATSHFNRNTWVPFRGCRIRFMLRPDELFALLRQGRLPSSFHSMSHLIRTSNITTRANRQFPAAGLSPAGFAALQAAPHSGQRVGVARRS